MNMSNHSLTKPIITVLLFNFLALLIQAAVPATPASAAAANPVSYFGEMKVSGNKINGSKTNRPMMVKGGSFFWSNWSGQFYTASTVNRMVDEFQAEIVRAAYGVDESGNPYNSSDESKVQTVVNAAIAKGIYVIIDWHSSGAQNNVNAAKSFFSKMAQQYGGYDNVIFEIYNEPVNTSWSTVKSYAEQVIPVIRQYSDNLIVVGTPTWSQDVDQAADNPITSYSNIAYTLHFYAGSHFQSLRDKANYALNKGIPLFVTEMGFVNADGDGAINYTSTNQWLDWLNQNNISWSNWAINDKSESASIFNTDGSLTAGGNFLKSILAGSAPYAEWRQSGSNTATTLYDFEGSTQGWTGSNVAAGPWSVNEWASKGTNSLKADIIMSANSQHYLLLTQTRDLSGKSTLSVTAKHASWGSVGNGLYAKLYVKTGSSWTWAEGSTVKLNSTGGTTLSINLSSVANLGDVKEIGVQFVSSSNSSGQTSVYIDNVTLQ
ncbi:glycoside hydrolase family 5 protein [Paenibacillus sp. HN-1]|uniref:glycoside hydrolase family 5 protein n=1 Tax=Paenibacillus TaxID=44249 RepID=UPI001CA9A5F6|nr:MULTISPECIES: glycoside hydrolase family 5 protein [Paenibacillus]MBY9079361.1 glycoside hydrolase family 5 protein [Paenibacillus sp. CGMCC 1.18879]MBY9087284.1 glycoside hydrolase family 5 protein [Paenibacillus sinensis]